jgi:hypothetical protein
MADTIEIRQYLRKYTLDDVKMNLQALKIQVGPSVNGQPAPGELFCPPPMLQFRVKTRVHVDGKPTTEWSEWEDVPIVREGEESA